MLDPDSSTTASLVDLSEQITCQYFTGGRDLCRIAKHTNGPRGHLDSFSGTVRKLRPEQIESFLRDRPGGAVGQESTHAAGKVTRRRPAEEAQNVESILVGGPHRAGTILDLVYLGHEQRGGARNPDVEYSAVRCIEPCDAHGVRISDDPFEPSHNPS